MKKKISIFVLLIVGFPIISMESEFYELKEDHHTIFSWGIAGMQGRRQTMEDTHTHELNFDGSPYRAFFGIYDGHGGIFAATQAAHNLHNNFLHRLNNGAPIDRGLIESYETTDSQIRDNRPEGLVKDGATALTAFFDAPYLWVAWAGDSRALVIRKNHIELATIDHKPNNPYEEQRIIQMGSAVDMISGIARIEGLAISRALGDEDYKRYSRYSIVATPEVKGVALEPGDIVLLACDGLWDVLDNEGATQALIDYLNQDQKELDATNPLMDKSHEDGNCEQLKVVARALRNKAYNQKSTDNISVMVIKYDGLECK